jgi:hypothetical protein
METKNREESSQNAYRRIALPAGILLITTGIIILVDQTLQTGWLNQATVATAGILLLASGVQLKKMLLLTFGSLFVGIGIGGLLAVQPDILPTWGGRIGAGLVFFSLSWILLFSLSVMVLKQSHWWPLLPGGIIGGLSLCFLTNALEPVDFIFFVGLGTGLPLLIWGTLNRLFGLIIPGSLLLGIAPGIYLAWGEIIETSSLAQTGIMLVCFAFGWILITLFSRAITEKFVWWPLIPGGILAMVGWGLYIGGNPGNALSFIGNTGSITLIIFGIYLILLRRGIE